MQLRVEARTLRSAKPHPAGRGSGSSSAGASQTPSKNATGHSNPKELSFPIHGAGPAVSGALERENGLAALTQMVQHGLQGNHGPGLRSLAKAYHSKSSGSESTPPLQQRGQRGHRDQGDGDHHKHYIDERERVNYKGRRNHRERDAEDERKHRHKKYQSDPRHYTEREHREHRHHKDHQDYGDHRDRDHRHEERKRRRHKLGVDTNEQDVAWGQWRAVPKPIFPKQPWTSTVRQQAHQLYRSGRSLKKPSPDGPPPADFTVDCAFRVLREHMVAGSEVDRKVSLGSVPQETPGERGTPGCRGCRHGRCETVPSASPSPARGRSASGGRSSSRGSDKNRSRSRSPSPPSHGISRPASRNSSRPPSRPSSRNASRSPSKSASRHPSHGRFTSNPRGNSRSPSPEHTGTPRPTSAALRSRSPSPGWMGLRGLRPLLKAHENAPPGRPGSAPCSVKRIGAGRDRGLKPEKFPELGLKSSLPFTPLPVIDSAAGKVLRIDQYTVATCESNGALRLVGAEKERPAPQKPATATVSINTEYDLPLMSKKFVSTEQLRTSLGLPIHSRAEQLGIAQQRPASPEHNKDRTGAPGNIEDLSNKEAEEKEHHKVKTAFTQKYFDALKDCVREIFYPHYPCYVLPFERFEQAGEIVAHEDLLQADYLLDAVLLDKRHSHIMFVSHEWLDLTHPDPRRIHYRTILTYASEKVQQFKDNLRSIKVNLFIDFCCMPQKAGDDQDLALKSLPYFISRVDSFVIAAPFYRHSSGRVCDVDSFKKRGWCQLEILARKCTALLSESIYISQDGSFPGESYYTGGSELRGFMRQSPLDGDFTCCHQDHTMEVAVLDKKEATTLNEAQDGEDETQSVDSMQGDAEALKEALLKMVPHLNEQQAPEATEKAAERHQREEKQKKNARSSRNAKEEENINLGKSAIRIKQKIPCDRHRIAPLVVGLYAAALYRAMHLHGKFKSTEIAALMKGHRNTLFKNPCCKDVLAEFDAKTGDDKVSLEDFEEMIASMDLGDILGTRYNMIFD